MSKVQTLRAFVQQRLSAAAEEIFELFERTIAEYEEELCGQRKLLDAVFKPEVRLHRADVQVLLVSKKEVPPEEQERSPRLDQEDPPEPPHIKEELEELWTSQEGEQLRGLEEADITKFTFICVPVKSEEDEEKPQLHQRPTEQVKTDADGEDCGGPEPGRHSDPDRHLQPHTDDKMSDSSEPETDDSCDWEETREPQSGLNSLQNNEGPVSDQECNNGKKSCSFSECATSFGCKGHLQKDNELKTGKKPSLIYHKKLHSEQKHFSCSVCKETFQLKKYVVRHMKVHTEEKPLSCSICKKKFKWRFTFVNHMRVHTEENFFRCSVCGRRFTRSSGLTKHLRVHTGKKPFSCSVCKKSFSFSYTLSRHMRLHTGERLLSCSVCNKTFAQSSDLNKHSRVHTGEKPFSCSVCKTSFSFRYALSRHMKIHTGERPFSCSVCDKTFTRFEYLKNHKCAGESRGSK
ncbi:zinc finger protein 501-like [Micropterus salmoides]|uniref:zinc finger protein 501-like n=1 Tax=Micropterus salmoides TaxID=27706 RepID=UPI0018ECC4C3|nr:zinc finger protein 501-like [Micropterus salmoides]